MKRQPGLVSFVDVGCAVRSTERRRATSVDETALGGLVVAVTESFDEESGEVERSFLCFDHEHSRPRVRWSVLREAEVDGTLIFAVDTTVLVRAWRRLAEEIAFVHDYQRRTGVAIPDEVRLAEAIRELQALVFGRDGILWGALERPSRKPAVPMRQAPVNVSALVD